MARAVLLRAGTMERSEDYPWSSAPGHCGLRSDPILSTEFPPPDVVENWAEWLRTGDEVEAVDRIRRHARTGRPCGAAGFMTRLENLLGRIVSPAKRGRKPKDTQSSLGGNRNS